ncbi:MAG TPA: PQQ-binding-like beta-propeller repeat protein [Bryobacteraceae bacterium]|jgi:outer membrane protein assembly factor BamB|nr:PQQ-binding-like beta-propeller repeat protein [Bryobacteraceae bacterium]
MWAICLLMLLGDWPQFRGPNGTGVADDDAAPPVKFGIAKWKTPLPVGHSSPVVWGERIFLTTFDKKLELVCLSAKNGSILWRHAAPATSFEETHAVSNPATASPAVDKERVYAYFSSYGLMTFSHDGEALWNAPLAMPKTHHGSGASPVLAGDLLIINHDAMSGGYLLAVDRRTGKEVWKQMYPASGRVESYSTPMVWHEQLILHRAGVIEGYRVADGTRAWSMAENTSGASTPVASDDVVYVSSWNNLGEGDQRPALPDFAVLLKKYDKNGDGAISAAEFPDDLKFTARPGLETIPNSQNYVAFRTVDRNKNGVIDEAEWEAFRNRVGTMATDHGLLAIRAGQVIWRENNSIPEVPSPLLYRGRLFLVRNGGVATCLDASTGKIIYRARIGATGAYFSSPVAAAGRVYFASSEGVVTVIAADSVALKVLARNEIGEEMIATPALVGGAIYLRSAGNLFAFGN